MSRSEKNVLWPIIMIATLLAMISMASATVTQFKVKGGETTAKTIDLIMDDRVLIKFSVIGGQSGNVLDFQFECPNGTAKLFSGIGSFDYSFVCDLEGQYTLRFTNTGTDEMLVSLEYEIQHYILGMPQMLFLTLVIVLLCVAAVAVFVLMSRPH